MAKKTKLDDLNPFSLPDGVQAISLEDPVEVHNAIADAVGEPEAKLDPMTVDLVQQAAKAEPLKVPEEVKEILHEHADHLVSEFKTMAPDEPQADDRPRKPKDFEG